MHRLTSHLRGLLVAIAALALTAGVAFAARPAGDAGLDRTTDAANKAVPTLGEEEEPTTPDLDEDDDEGAPEADDEDEAEDEAEDATDGERAENHGWYVSQAAHEETPDGYKNHGEYVSEVAHGDDGKPGSDDEVGGEDDEATTGAVQSKGRSDAAKARNAERKAGRGR